MKSLNLLVVGEDRELQDFEDALEGCKRYVGPLKLFTSTKAVDAVSRLQKLMQTCGHCHAAFLMHQFTMPGKAEFSETLRKVLKEKHPDVPIICWGNPKKGGDLNKHYHATVEFKKGGDANQLVDVLKQIQAGQIVPEYLHKDQRKSLERRGSMERSASIGRSDSITRTASIRRTSVEGTPPVLDHSASRRSPHGALEDEHPAASPRMGTTPTLRRKSIEYGSGMPGPLPPSPSMHSGGASINNAMAASMGMGGMGMGSMGGMGMGNMSMNSGMTMGMGMAGMSMGSMGHGVGMGMGGGSVSSGTLPAIPLGMGGGSISNTSIPPMGMGGMQMGGMGGMGMGGGMGGMGMAGGAGDMSGMMRNMSLQDAPAAVPAPAAAGSSAEMIKMLSEEVMRLRKAVEEKRAREAEIAAMQAQLAQLQQQMAASGGMPMGAGMPMGF